MSSLDMYHKTQRWQLWRCSSKLKEGDILEYVLIHEVFSELVSNSDSFRTKITPHGYPFLLLLQMRDDCGFMSPTSTCEP